MTDQEINKRIYELTGLRSRTSMWFCLINYNFTTDWRAFGLLLEFIRNHEYFFDFCYKYGDLCSKDEIWLPLQLVSPRALAEAVVEFFEEGKS